MSTFHFAKAEGYPLHTLRIPSAYPPRSLSSTFHLVKDVNNLSAASEVLPVPRVLVKSPTGFDTEKYSLALWIDISYDALLLFTLSQIFESTLCIPFYQNFHNLP